jgi:hypothetical protein
MSKFALDKNFESIRAGVPGSPRSFELLKASKDEYILLEHVGNQVAEICSFTKSELKSIWIMLTARE